MSHLPAALNPKEEDIQRLLFTQAHLGSRNLEPGMARYTYKRRADGKRKEYYWMEFDF